MADELVRLAASGLGVGWLPVAPGTWGTLVAVPLYLALAGLSAAGYVAATLAFAVLAVLVAGRAERLSGVQDPGAIVIDEMAGFLVAMFQAPPGWRGVAAGFVLFRVFDILKPPPVKAVEALGGGAAVVADDLVAGLYANLALRLIIWAGLLGGGR